MTPPHPSFTVRVDVTNPGQFFACCGLLELSQRLWPGAEGWFDAANLCFAIHTIDARPSLERLIDKLRRCTISGLTEAERDEREAIEKEKRELKKQGGTLPEDKEARRKELGEKARSGALRLELPYDLFLDWWQADDGTGTPKTWAGRQEVHKVARATQDSISGIEDLRSLFDHGCVLQRPDEYCKKQSDRGDSVEPFCFDARRFAHALDVGFSLDTQKTSVIAHPAVELLSLIGLQRFRPCPASVKWSFEYWTWIQPLHAPVAAGVVCGAVPASGRRRYRFPLRFRDDQKRYKAFGWATPIGEDT